MYAYVNNLFVIKFIIIRLHKQGTQMKKFVKFIKMNINLIYLPVSPSRMKL